MDVVLQILLEVITVADKLENTVQFGVGFWINRVASEIVRRLCKSQLECGHPGNSFLTWFRRVYSR